MAEAAEQIGKDSNGRMELQVFPDAQLGGDNDLMSQARAGAIEFCQPTGQILASILPVTAISALGFAWSDYAKVWPAMDGDLGKYIRGQIAAKAEAAKALSVKAPSERSRTYLRPATFRR